MSRAKMIVNPKDMPTDFWNYRVNPIVGYYIKPIKIRDLGKRDKRTNE